MPVLGDPQWHIWESQHVYVSYITGVISGIDVMPSSLLYCTADGNLSKAKQWAGNAHQFERPLKL